MSTYEKKFLSWFIKMRRGYEGEEPHPLNGLTSGANSFHPFFPLRVGGRFREREEGGLWRDGLIGLRNEMKEKRKLNAGKSKYQVEKISQEWRPHMIRGKERVKNFVEKERMIKNKGGCEPVRHRHPFPTNSRFSFIHSFIYLLVHATSISSGDDARVKTDMGE